MLFRRGETQDLAVGLVGDDVDEAVWTLANVAHAFAQVPEQFLFAGNPARLVELRASRPAGQTARQMNDDDRFQPGSLAPV